MSYIDNVHMVHPFGKHLRDFSDLTNRISWNDKTLAMTEYVVVSIFTKMINWATPCQREAVLILFFGMNPSSLPYSVQKSIDCNVGLHVPDIGEARETQ